MALGEGHLLKPDPWQSDVITGGHQRLLLNGARQSGKTTVVAVLGLVEALVRPMTRVLLVSRSLRQSREMFRLMTHYHGLLQSPALKRNIAAIDHRKLAAAASDTS